MSQFGSRPHHNAIDTVATLVHKIQATRQTGNAGALLLFDISGFFDNVNPERATQVFRQKGFPDNVCRWTQSFLTGRSVSLKIGSTLSEPCEVHNGTPQGSPLSPILSALYTASLLDLASRWTHRDLTLYVDDGAIFSVSKTTTAAAASAIPGLEQALGWLSCNGLSADPAKTELMVFTPRRANPDLVGGHIYGATYGDNQRVTTVTTSLRYLRVHLTLTLKWDTHVDLMVNRARSTIRGISILGNSIRGLDFMNWRRVYNALVIPTLTYGAQVWYNGVQQKCLLNRLQIAQNEGIRKMTGVFRTTPIEPLHNLTRIPPIPYLMGKLMHSYSHRLRDLPSSAKVRTILTTNQCQYWPEYVNPITNLSRASRDLGERVIRAPVLSTAGTWTHPHFTYVPKPPPHIIARYKESMAHPEAADTYIIILHHIRLRRHLATFHITRTHTTLSKGITQRQDQMQAICRAVTTALTTAIPTLHPTRIILWLPYTHACDNELTHLSSSTDSAARALITAHLDTADYYTFDLRTVDRRWPGTLSKAELRTMELEQHTALPLDPATANPKATMWGKIHADYQPNPRPSFIACDPPSDNIPPPAIRAAAKCKSRLISSTIFRWATNHSFDANYSDCFRQGADDPTLCPCADPNHPHFTPSHPYRPYRHTKEHVLFRCPCYTHARTTHLHGLTSLRVIFRLEENTARLCAFAATTNCSLLCPLHNPAPRLDPP